MAAELFNTFVQSCPFAGTVGISEKLAISQGGVTKGTTVGVIGEALAANIPGGFPQLYRRPFLDQNTDIARATLFTVPVDGVYLVSVSWACTVLDLGATGPAVTAYYDLADGTSTTMTNGVVLTSLNTNVSWNVQVLKGGSIFEYEAAGIVAPGVSLYDAFFSAMRLA